MRWGRAWGNGTSCETKELNLPQPLFLVGEILIFGHVSPNLNLERIQAWHFSESSGCRLSIVIFITSIGQLQLDQKGSKLLTPPNCGRSGRRAFNSPVQLISSQLCVAKYIDSRGRRHQANSAVSCVPRATHSQ